MSSVLARIFFKGSVFNPLHLHAKVFFKSFIKIVAKIEFFYETMFFLAFKNKVHFHPFAVIISPYHAVGIIIYIKKNKTNILLLGDAPTSWAF
jgi:hypothetical protein